MLDLHRLRLLQQFAIHGTIARTAASLGFSPSAVSQQLATLEREAGAPLLDRTARSAVLTDLGRRLVGHAEVVLQQVEMAEADLAAHAGRAVGRVEICAVPTAAVHLAPALAALRRDEPAVQLVVRQAGSTEAVARLRSREADVAVIDVWGETPPSRWLHHEPLLDDPLVLAVPADHPMAVGTRDVDLRRASDEPWICAPLGEPSREVFDRMMAAAGAVPENLWEFQGLGTIVALVRRGVGSAVVPRLAIPDPVPPDLVVRELPGGPSRSIDAVARVAARERPATAATLRALGRATRGGMLQG